MRHAAAAGRGSPSSSGALSANAAATRRHPPRRPPPRGRALLLGLADAPDVRACAGHGDRVRGVGARCRARPDLAALLVRPDNFVARAADPEAAAPRRRSPARRPGTPARDAGPPRLSRGGRAPRGWCPRRAGRQGR
ncbi:hypothetical protein [Streptomyces sp. NPDC093260]|uniref:aromatic-ring hydroxylase C-terminal domain-containing protein n=1 Tax=Streptomyces sp. NPDC093260 TaxID=3155073 RepID=UPI0034355885